MKDLCEPVAEFIWPENKYELLAYEWNPNTRMLLLLGSHENFYRNLKRG